MPFGIPWSKYLFHWGIGLSGAVAGSQVVHMFYKPLDGFEELIKVEAARIYETENLSPLSKHEKLKAILELDKYYIEKFNLNDSKEQ